MSHGPDWSDSEDSLFGDDNDYSNFKAKIKSYNSPNQVDPTELTEEQKKLQDLNSFFSAVSSGNIKTVIEFLEKGFDANLDIRDGWTPILLSASYGNPDLAKVLIEFGADVNQHRDKVTALMMACNCPESTSPFPKSLALIELLVEKGADVKVINRKRMNALMYAACTGNLPAVKYLVPKADKCAVDNQRWNALTWAVSNNQVDVAEHLLSEGFDINLTDVRGHTVLDIAKDGGFESIVNLFPKQETDFVTELIDRNKLEFEDNFSGLKKGEKSRFFSELCDILLSVKCGQLIPLFLDKNVSLDQFLSMNDEDLKQIGVLLPYQRRRILTGLHRFHKQPYHPKSLHVCLKTDTYSNLDVATQVMSAIQQIIAMEASLKFVLKSLQETDLAKEQREVAQASVRNIKLKIASSRMVLKKFQGKFKKWDKRVEPADLITKHSIRSLFGDDNDYSNFKAKIKSYNSPNQVDPTELTEEQKKLQDLNSFFSAVSSGNIKTVIEFLEKGFDANLDIRDGWTPILLSASYGNPDLAKVLIEFGADVNQHRDKVTALMMACNCPESTSPFPKSLALIELLVEKGADVKVINRKRMNALMYAACTGNLPAVKYLVPKADKCAVDNQRWNALTWAVSNNQVDVAEHLLSEGFDINLTDVRGHTVLDIAKDGGFESIVNLFPKQETDFVTELIDRNKLEFEDNFSGLKKGEKSRFFSELCDILLSVKCGQLIPLFLDKNVSLDQFLSMNDEDLKQIGVLLPYQRRRILTGLHRFHKQPYHPKSLHVCLKTDTYSNLDVATQVMSAIQQIIAMEASLKFVLKSLQETDLAKEQREVAQASVRNIKLKIASSRMVLKKFQGKFKKWDKRVEPADLITKHSIRSKFPWRKMTFCIGLISLIIVCKLRK